MKKLIKKITSYQMSKEVEKLFLDFMKGELTSYEFAKKVGISHQQSFNLIGGICKQWYREGKLKIKL